MMTAITRMRRVGAAAACYCCFTIVSRIPVLVECFQVTAPSCNSWHSCRRTTVDLAVLASSSSSLLLSLSATSSTSSSSSINDSLVDQDDSASASDGAYWKTDLTLGELQELLATAHEAARAAGSIIRNHLGCCSEQAQECEIKYSIKDIVTEYDQQAQRAIEGIVRNRYPAHDFLGEEDVDPGAAASQAALEQRLQQQGRSPFLWICDPIDGTANFASGLELCAVTMGVVYKGTPIVGVVYDPHRDEMFSALKGQGATVGTITKLQVAQAVTDVNEAIINAGCPADPNAFETSMRGVLALNGRSRGLRMIACSALTLAWIASGRLAAHFGYDLSSWDLVAGALLIQESGGRVTDLDGSEYKLTTRNMLCSNGHVHDEILDILRAADAVSFTRSL